MPFAIIQFMESIVAAEYKIETFLNYYSCCLFYYHQFIYVSKGTYKNILQAVTSNISPVLYKPGS